MTEQQKIRKQIDTMKQYLIMNVEREDWHAVWDGAIDIQRLNDKLVALDSIVKIFIPHSLDITEY